MINLIIHGCNGKMGQVVSYMAQGDEDINIVAGIDKFPNAISNPYPVYSSLMECKEKGDVIIDFSVPGAIPNLLNDVAKQKIPVVIATTGLDEKDISLINEVSNTVPVFRAANMSLGVNLMYELVNKAASVLQNQFDIEIIERHHNQKIDSPSGTAYALADSINEAFNNTKDFVYGRHSKTEKRMQNEIGIHAVRGGTIAGDHTVIFAGKDEILEITHSAHSKQIFAAGAITAAKYIITKQPGLYDMKDVMLEKSIVTNVCTSNDEAMITINNLPNNTKTITGIFKGIADENINIDMISQTAPVNGYISISFTLPEKDLNTAIKLIGEFNSKIPSMRTDVFVQITKLTVEGLGMERQTGVAAKVFEIMSDEEIDIKLITTSEIKISYVIDQINENRAVEALVKAFGI